MTGATLTKVEMEKRGVEKWGKSAGKEGKRKGEREREVLILVSFHSL